MSENILVGAIGTVVAMGIFLLVVGIIIFAAFATAIILLCLSIKEKNELKVKGIDEDRIKKIVSLSIWSLIITILSCTGCVLMVLPILALSFTSSNAKTALQAGNVAKAVKESDTALLMIIISNSIVIGLCALNFASSAIKIMLNK